MKQNTIIASLTGFVAAGLLFAPLVHADMCTTQYGGTQTCVPSDLTINKQVFKPVVDETKGGLKQTTEVVDNLTTTDVMFTPGSLVTYRLTVHNDSGQTFNPVNIKDILPPYMVFHSSTNTTASYDAPTNSVNFKLENVIAGSDPSFEVTLRVMDADKFPANIAQFCVANVAEVRALNRYDSDSAQVCLKNGTTTVTKLPVAGFEDFALLLPFAGVMLGGFALLKGKKTV